METIDLASVFKALSAGDYVPACAALLGFVTRSLRRRWFDPKLERMRGRYTTRVHRDHLEHAAGVAVVTWGLGHARAFLPLMLAALGWGSAVLLGADASVAGKAFGLGAVAAMAGYDTAKGASTVLRALAARRSSALPPRTAIMRHRHDDAQDEPDADTGGHEPDRDGEDSARRRR